MIGVKLVVGLLGLGLALLPGTARADPTDDAPKQGQLDPEYAAGKAAIAAKDWKAAIRSLSSAALRDTRNADIENYLGYAYRQSGQLSLAFTQYQRALQFDPRHRGAHAYIGEAYLIANNLTKAEEHLAALQRICLIPCEVNTATPSGRRSRRGLAPWRLTADGGAGLRTAHQHSRGASHDRRRAQVPTSSP